MIVITVVIIVYRLEIFDTCNSLSNNYPMLRCYNPAHLALMTESMLDDGSEECPSMYV